SCRLAHIGELQSTRHQPNTNTTGASQDNNILASTSWPPASFGMPQPQQPSNMVAPAPPPPPNSCHLANSLLLQLFFVLFFFAMPSLPFWTLVAIYWLYHFKSSRFEGEFRSLNLFPAHAVKHHSLSGKVFQKMAKFAIKWTFDIREEITHFRH